MKARLKKYILEQNARGRLHWVRPLVHSLHEPLRYSPRRYSRLLRYLYALVFKGHRAMPIHWDTKNAVFYVSVRDIAAGHRTVVKIPRLDNRFALVLADSIRHKGGHARYCQLLRSLPKQTNLGRHLPEVFTIARDGGYESAYVDGISLSSVWRKIRETQTLPEHVEPGKLIGAIDDLLSSLHSYWTSGAAPMGDWALHNLVYDYNSGSITNVDLEGFFTYGPASFEAKPETTQRDLTALRKILQLIARSDAEAQEILMALASIWRTTQSGASYSGIGYGSGYHSLTLRGEYFRGQRECSARLAGVPYDFTNKIVLDLGCNCGGMLHHLAETITSGVGIDYDSCCVNAASVICHLEKRSNLRFFTFDLDKGDLRVLSAYLACEEVDICFLLSVCMWLEDWKPIIKFASQKATTLLFESNGTELQQAEQVDYLRLLYERVDLIDERSLDDPFQTNRSLYLCSKFLSHEG